MRLRSVGCVLTLVFAAACATAPESAPAPASVEFRAPTLAMAGDHGGWTPDEALLRRALRVWDSGGPGPSDKDFESLPLAERVTICRAGLRLENRAAAAACADHLRWKMLDRWELHRAWDVQCDGFFELPGRDAGELLDIQSNAGMTRLLARIEAAPRGAFTGTNVGWLHKSVRADHIPALARLTFHESEAVRTFVWDALGLLAEVTDRHREHIAAALLRTSVGVARERYPRTDGVPELLVQVLNSAWVEDGVEAAWTPPSHEKRFRMWAHRWLRACVPTPRDVPLFARKAREYDDMLAWNLRHLDTPYAARVLRELRVEEPESLGALGALAVQGDRSALDELATLALTSDEAPAVLLAAAPHEGTARLVRAVRETRGEQRDEILWSVRYAWLSAGRELGIRPPDEAFEEFVQRLNDAGLDSGPPWPEGSPFHTRASAEAELSSMPDDLAPEDIGEWTFAPLETAAPGALRGKLRRWAASDDPRTAHLGFGLLAMLGESVEDLPLPAGWNGAEHAVDLLEFAPTYNCQEGIPWRRIEAARHGVGARDHLAEAVRNASNEELDSACTALAIHDGLPEPATWLLQVSHDDPGLQDRMRDLLVDGRPGEAITLSMRADPSGTRDAGLVDDEAVLGVLRELQDRRELSGYYAGTQELALAGDPMAEREIAAVIADGFYRWVDEMSWRVMLRGDPMARMPAWFDFIETNCCQRAIPINWLFSHATETDVDHVGTAVSTPATDARRWWRRIGGRLVWSKIARRWVPAPR